MNDTKTIDLEMGVKINDVKDILDESDFDNALLEENATNIREGYNHFNNSDEMVLMTAELFNAIKCTHAEMQRCDEIMVSAHFADNVTFLQQVNNFLQEHPIINMAVSAMVGGIVTEALKHSGEIIENFFDLGG